MKLISIALILFCFVVGVHAQTSICIDPGHGGSDPGATGHGLLEKSINLDVSNRLASLLRNAGWTVHMTRSSDQTVSLSGRTSYANSLGVKRFVSIHCNACNQTAHGTETFCYTDGSSTSFNMRNKVHPPLVSAMGTYDRGCKTASFYVIKYTNMPAILCELAFIDNASDAAKLGDSYYRQKAAEAIKRGLDASYSRDEETEKPGMAETLQADPSYEGLFPSPDASLKVENDKIWFHQTQLSDDKDVYFHPRLSPDKTMVVYEGLATGIHVSDISGKNHIALGQGHRPCFSADSKKVIFDSAVEGDHEILDSDIYLVDLKNPLVRINLTKEFKGLAQQALVSLDGKLLAFYSEGIVYVGKLGKDKVESCVELKK